MTRKELDILIESLRQGTTHVTEPESKVLSAAYENEARTKAAEIDADARIQVANLEASEGKRNRIAMYVTTGISAAVSIAGLVMKSIMFREGLTFEQTGVYTSVMTKSMAQDAVRGDGTKKF